MENKKNNITLVLLLALVILIAASTTFKVMDRHEEKLLLVARRKIEEAARQCYLENKCTGESTYLGFLIKEGYLEAQVHPISKEFISEELTISCKDFECTTELNCSFIIF